MRLLLVLILLSYTSHALIITEVMYNPDGGDTNREWIEIYNNETEPFNISDLKLVTDNTNHNLDTNSTSEILQNGSFVVIVQNISAFHSDFPEVSNVVDSSWTSLSNSGDENILIKNSSSIFDNFTYSPIAAEGNSICRNETSFYECSPSPGSLATIENNQSNSGDCDIEASIQSDLLFDGTVNYNTILSGLNCSSSPIEYWIEDLFGSQLRYFSTTQACSSVSRQWTPGEITGSEAFKISLRIYPVCNDTNISNDLAEKTIIVKGNPLSNESSLSITEVENGSFGGSINVDINLYRGDTAKYAVKVYVKDLSGTKVSAESTIHVMSKYTLYEFSTPVQMKTYCSSEFKDGFYTVVVEGLDKTDEEQVFISGTSNCKTVTVSSGGGGGGGGFIAPKDTFFSVTYPETVFVGEEFETVVKFNVTSRKKFTAYSYVFKGNTPVSEGFDGISWKGIWTANSKDVTIDPKNGSVSLLSRIEDGTQPGLYSLRVKIKGDKEDEFTKEVQVKEKPVNIPEPKKNVTLNTSSSKVSGQPITGFAPKRSRAHEILPLLNAILRQVKLF